LGFERVHVLGRGVDTELFNPRRRREDLRGSWGCRPRGTAVLYVGRLAAEKNLGLALQAFEDIAARLPDAKLVLVGDGPELARLRHVRPEPVLTGAKVGTELAEHFASGDLFLFPSLTETFGNVVPEAMASGLAVIAFGCGAARVWINSGENGVTVPRGDSDAFCEAALMVACDEMRLRTMGEGARATAEGMSWGRVVGDLEELLLEVIDRHRTEHRHESLAATTE
jgi:glycosyltransferase involved in cell wall biosynthesis